jgi:hypothetical protein
MHKDDIQVNGNPIYYVIVGGTLTSDDISFKCHFPPLVIFLCVCEFPQIFYTPSVFWTRGQLPITVGIYLNVFNSKGNEPGNIRFRLFIWTASGVTFWSSVSMEEIDQHMDVQIWLKERCPLICFVILPYIYICKSP